MTEWRFLLAESIEPKAATYLEKETLWQGADERCGEKVIQ
jgi:hypothetical protein